METDLGLLAVSDSRLFWLDGSTNIYELTGGTTWAARERFAPVSKEQIPVDSIPRAVVGL